MTFRRGKKQLAAGLLKRAGSSSVTFLRPVTQPSGLCQSAPMKEHLVKINNSTSAALTVVFVIQCWCMNVAIADPFATTVVAYDPAPGQFVNNAAFNDPAMALAAPNGAGTGAPNNSSMVSLGGFGGSITLGFDHTIDDDAANPFGLDVIVFGNAFWAAGDANRRWAECAYVEVSRDANGNSLADDQWYLIPGSHITNPIGQTQSQIWDDNFGDATHPPANPAWWPAGLDSPFDTTAFRLPPAVFDIAVLENPNGLAAEIEGVWGYADHSPTLVLGDLNADNVVDDAGAFLEAFYVVPDNPFAVGITHGSGGGDGFDIAWAIDVATGAPANLAGIDFVRITNGVNFVAGALGEISAEIDAVADVAAGSLGDANGDGEIDDNDAVVLIDCMLGPQVIAPSSPCRVMDFDQDSDVDLRDSAALMEQFDVDK